MKHSISLREIVSALLLAAGLMLAAQQVPAQIYYSLRTQALNVNFAGIIEDELTGMYLNPARVGLVDRRELSAAKFPDRTISIPFPTSQYLSRYSIGQLAPAEYDYVSYRYSPISISLLTPLGGSLRAAIGVEVAHSNSDDLTGDSELMLESDNFIRNENYSRLHKRGQDHAVLSIALAAPIGKSYAGMRLAASYDGEKYRDIYDRTRYMMPAAMPDEIYISQDYDLSALHYETTSFAIETGLYRPGHFFSDLMLRFGWRRSLFPVTVSDSYYENEDYDDNGNSIYNNYPDLTFDEIAFESNRDYRELALHGRAHLNLGHGMRATQTVSWSRGDGDGSALFNSTRDHRESTDELFIHDLSFRYDGEYSNFYLSSTIGHTRDIRDRVQVTIGAKAIYQRRTFDEDGSGEYHTLYASEYSADSLVLESGYLQTHRDDDTYYYLILPIAVECRLHKYVSLQMSAEMVGSHYNNKDAYDQAISLESPPVLLNDRFESAEYLLYSTTAMHYSSGLAVNIDDILLVDMLYGSSSSVGFTSYGYVSVRYRF